MIFVKTVCQSCASPIRKDSDKGKERSGGYSEFYCRRCYQSGHFTDPKMTLVEMHNTVQSKMIELRFPRYLADELANRVQNLKRWEVVKV